jgi:hypothetical protein
MNIQRFLNLAVIPACSDLAQFGVLNTLPAQRLMLAIALQESNLQYRRQVSALGVQNGPAASYYQFERNGACKGVLQHRVTGPIIKAILSNYDIAPDKDSMWEAMRYHDIVASAAARLLIHTLPQQLPATAADGWQQYLDGWRPGKPHPDKWAGNWLAADDLLKACA